MKISTGPGGAVRKIESVESQPYSPDNMSFTMDYFQTLRGRFPAWTELRAHLQSADGGSLRIIEVDGSPFAVIRTVKGKSSACGVFRSVVWDTVANRPVCVAPPKAAEGLPPLQTPLVVEDFVDGFMVQAFLTADDPHTLRLATRTTVGGENKFYSKKTFGVLLEEALAATPVRTLDALKMHLREGMVAASATATFVSFVVQHPEHRIVAKSVSPDLHIVHLGVVAESGAVQIWEGAAGWPVPLRRLQIGRYPVGDFHAEQEIQDLLRSTAVAKGFRWQGLVFKDGAGKRWRMRTPSYTMLRTLRGAEAAPLDRFLRLRREGGVVEYLKHFGSERSFPGTANTSVERQTLWGYELALRAKTAQVLAAYELVHKAHAAKFADLPPVFKPAVHLLHVAYLETLRPKGYKVLLRNAVDVVNHLKDFEQRRLLVAEDFVAPTAEPSAETQEGVLYGGDEE